MKTNKKIKNTALESELFKLFNNSIDYSPEQMKAAIKEATAALDSLEEDELDELESFKEDFYLLTDEFN